MNDEERDRERISELEMRQRELESALSELDHQARRLGDRVERDGGAMGDNATERKALDRNRQLNREELETVRAQLRRLRADDASG